MSVLSFSKMPFSRHAGWPELGSDPRVVRNFWLFLVPLSLLPPLMIYFAGSHYGEDAFAYAFVYQLGSGAWGRFAALFFLCELASVMWMGWLIGLVAGAWDQHISDRNAYLLSVICAAPLWISSVGLVVPSLAFNVALGLVALCLSCGLLFHGIRRFCRISDRYIDQAIAITRLAFGGGCGAWALVTLLLTVR